MSDQYKERKEKLFTQKKNGYDRMEPAQQEAMERY